nr:hypothetical protein [uncultured Duganella sp.]
MGSYGIWHWGILFSAFFLFPLFYIIPLWKIVAKAGYSGAWSLLGLVPVLNFVMLWVFAFSAWPRERS